MGTMRVVPPFPVTVISGASRGTADSGSETSSVARNPAAQAQVQPFAFLGFALAEATGLFGLAITFLILFVF